MQGQPVRATRRTHEPSNPFRTYSPTRLGFGPLPIIFSTNLCLWFKPEWFHMQFFMGAVGFAAKALTRWQKDGRSTHVFNPSSFPLSLFSLGLILTSTTDPTHRSADTAVALRHLH